MLEEEALVVIYRSLRDSISSNIADVEYNEKERSIYLTLKGRAIPYSSKGEVKASGEGPTLNGSTWKICEDGVSNCSIQKEHEESEKKSWIKKLFGGKE